MGEISPEDRSVALSKTFEAENLAPSIFNVKSDGLHISHGTGKDVPAKVNKGIVLSQLSSAFDPLGLFFSFTVSMRLLLKGIWKKQGQSWDEELPPEDEKAFKDWASELSHTKELSFKRN